MSYKKNTLLLIIIFSLTVGNKLYGYIEQTFNKLIYAYKKNEPLSTFSQIENKKSNNPLKKNQLTKKNTIQDKDHFQLTITQNNKCSKPPLKDIITDVHTYIKSDGSTGYKEIKKYYYLNTNLGQNANAFLNELNIKLNATFKHIENQLKIKLNKAITLNLIFQPTRTDYENKVREFGLSPEGNQGMYIYPNNVSIIQVQNYEQGIKTAIHEAIHAFNKAYWGNSLRFINEGMAEYFESITTKGLIPPFDFSWLTHQQYPQQISTLLFSEIDWHGDNTHELYQNSKALFHFLMSHDKGRQVLQKIMEYEMENPCTTLQNQRIEALFFQIFLNHQQEFDYWFSSGLYDFLNRNKTNTAIIY